MSASRYLIFDRTKRIFPTPAEREWQKISANLDRWNAEHGRFPQTQSNGPLQPAGRNGEGTPEIGSSEKGVRFL